MASISVERASRYKDKLDLLFKRTGQAEKWLADASAQDFLKDEKTMLASYKAFQEAVEASQDLVAMMCKDTGIRPQNDYSNLERLESISTRSRNVLIEANGLRNHLVHKYKKKEMIFWLWKA